MTRLELQTKILKRPTFARFDDSSKLQAQVAQAIQDGIRITYDRNRLTNPHWEKTTLFASLPTGAAYSTGLLYSLTQATTPPLPTDVKRIKSLVVLSGTVVTPSSSTYDSDSTEGMGIPADTTNLPTTNSVYHELVSDDAAGSLDIFIGTTVGGTPKVRIKYARTLTEPIADATALDVPEHLFQELYSDVDFYLRYYVGFAD